MTQTELARAKVNLALHVTGRRPDGYHLLDSLVVFPLIGDLIEAEQGAGLSLSLDGPFAIDLGSAPDNLVLRAAEMMGGGAALRLTKNLPVASGIGGGSADAAATLRLLARRTGREAPDGLSLGADVPVCVASTPARMQGIGEALTPMPAFPEFGVVLANPGLSVPTPAVFQGLARRDNPGLGSLPDRFDSFEVFCDYLSAQRNDLEPPALQVAPQIAKILSALRALPGARLARMSGSGATSFALFKTAKAAESAADVLRAALPSCWVAAAPVAEWKPR